MSERERERETRFYRVSPRVIAGCCYRGGRRSERRGRTREQDRAGAKSSELRNEREERPWGVVAVAAMVVERVVQEGRAATCWQSDVLTPLRISPYTLVASANHPTPLAAALSFSTCFPMLLFFSSSLLSPLPTLFFSPGLVWHFLFSFVFFIFTSFPRRLSPLPGPTRVALASREIFSFSSVVRKRRDEGVTGWA